MFNVFKALKLQGVTTLPGVTRPAGPGRDPGWRLVRRLRRLAARQPDRADHDDGRPLAGPVVLVLRRRRGGQRGARGTDSVAGRADRSRPDALQHDRPRPDHGAAARRAARTPSPRPPPAPAARPWPARRWTSACVTGPNTGATGQAVTNANGQATFTYTDTGGPGRDTIRAFIGTLGSNTVEALWQVPGCPGARVVALQSPMFPLDQGWRRVNITGVTGATVTQICQDEPPNFENIAAWAVDADGVGTSCGQRPRAALGHAHGARQRPRLPHLLHRLELLPDRSRSACRRLPAARPSMTARSTTR